MQQIVMDAYRRIFQAEPTLLVRAPGRVNLIGEHTDYNDGFVLPMAINRAAWLALAPRPDRTVKVYSVNYDQTLAFDLDHLQKEKHDWIEYLKGVAWALGDAGHALHGWQGALAGDVPLGSGLSSSAALELATARAFAALGSLRVDEKELALLGQKAENRWVGVNCGIMDQLISSAGCEGHALLIDCRTLTCTPVPMPAETAVVIMDTTKRRGLADSAYNERRAQCEQGAALFGVAKLRDVTSVQLAARKSEMDTLTYRRCHHVVSENERTVQAAEMLKAGDAAAFGHLMDASHVSLRDDFEVSCAELDAIVDAAQASPGCHGARMTGAGFGGCAVALVDEAQVEAFVASVAARYKQATGRQAEIFVSKATDGARAFTTATA